MQSTIENIDTIKRLLKITVPAQEILNDYNAQLRKAMKSARIDGFRKGHVPATIVEQHYGASILEEALNSNIGKSLDEGIKEHNLDVVGKPEIKVTSAFDKNVDLVFEATVEIFPELELKPLSELKIDVIKSEVKDQDVVDMIEVLRKQRAIWEVKDGLEAQDGTLAKINFLGRVDGKEFAGGKAEDFELHVGETPMIPGFTDQIKGHKAGEKFTIQVKFPEQYHEQTLAGKDAEFDIEVKSVSEAILPELNADFMNKFGIKDGDLEKFKAELAKNMNRELIRTVQRRNAQTVFDGLADLYGEFEVPKALVESEIAVLKQNLFNQFRQYGIKDESFLKNFKDEGMEKEAQKRARVSVIVHALSKSFNLETPSQEYIDTELNLISQAYEDPSEVIKQIKADKKTYGNVLNAAFEHALVDNIIKDASTTEVEKSFNELIHA